MDSPWFLLQALALMLMNNWLSRNGGSVSNLISNVCYTAAFLVVAYSISDVDRVTMWIFIVAAVLGSLVSYFYFDRLIPTIEESTDE